MVSIDKLKKQLAKERSKVDKLKEKDTILAEKKRLKKELFLLRNPNIARIGRGFKKGTKFLVKKAQEFKAKELAKAKMKKPKKMKREVERRESDNGFFSGLEFGI